MSLPMFIFFNSACSRGSRYNIRFRRLQVLLMSQQIRHSNQCSDYRGRVNEVITKDAGVSASQVNEVEFSVIGTTDSGLVPGLTYSANPQRMKMSNDGGGNTVQIQTNETYYSKIKLVLEKESVEKIRHNEYSTMIKSSAPEGIGRQQQQQQQEVQHPLFVSLLFPIPILLDLPLSTISDQQQVSNKDLIPNNDDTNNQSPIQGFLVLEIFYHYQ
jgi:hypothetical protein